MSPPTPQMAVYFCSGALRDPAQFRHYALNVPLYTHFTSPIRRFADVLVHRLLASALGKGAARGGAVPAMPRVGAWRLETTVPSLGRPHWVGWAP